MRSDGDTWDIVSSVGLTALAVATFRALESTRPDAIIEDKFASWFVEAAAEPHFTALLKDPTLLEDTPFGGFMGVANQVLRRILLVVNRIRSKAGGNRCSRVGFACVPAGLELRIDGIRSGSAKGAGVQSRSARCARRPAEDR